ncbi:dipeptide epimerase [Spongiactinospora sp. TRM90649]|uniref:mandelate racemase/muconate lactonizing enzyme family protein n=1 Tax=Spongiactinospora sp. TRM90649 TaxID=3031114 RepID=UPI0023F77986|nr:dipeptide epimerase [Spongiactinospora sp. TRM90649]MDF5752481.1 dipeptide epimerase [Spongiactinospora sp. TRM90649]
MSARIERVRVIQVDVPLVRPFVTAVRRADRLRTVLVEVSGENGGRGWGEAAVNWRTTGESPQSVAAAVLGPIADAVTGLSADDHDSWGRAVVGSVVGNPAARSAVDCALWDLAARRADRSLAEFLGGHEEPVRTDMTLSAGPPSELLDRAVEHVAEGFRTLKVKVAPGEDGIAGVELLRRELGSEIGLRVDANQAWNSEEAIAAIRRWEEAGVGLEFVEQPVPAADIDGLTAVRAAVDTPVMADESVWNTRDLHQLIRYGAADRVNVKLAKSGGLTEARRMIALAEDSGVGVMIGCMLESHVGVAASAALAAALGPATAPQDLDSGLWTTGSPVQGGVAYQGPNVIPATAPGLGIITLAHDADATDLHA